MGHVTSFALIYGAGYLQKVESAINLAKGVCFDNYQADLITSYGRETSGTLQLKPFTYGADGLLRCFHVNRGGTDVLFESSKGSLSLWQADFSSWRTI